MKTLGYLGAAAAAVALTGGAALADGISNDVVKIGVLGDMSGVYSTGFSGEGAVAAVKMAVEDFGGTVLGKNDRGDLGRPPEQGRRRLRRPRANGSTRTMST